MIRSQRGFTFVQTLVSLGLLGGLFIVGFKLFQDQTKLGESSSFQFESIIVLDEIKSLLNDEQSCTASFKGLSAIYEEVAEIKRFNPVTQRSDMEFGVFMGDKPIYGQKDVVIQRMVLLGENSGFHFEKGHVLLKVFFQKFQEQGTEFQGSIPMRVEVDEIGKILSCETSPGLHQERSNEGEFNPWRENVYGSEKIKAIEHQGQKLVIGDIEAKAKLNVEGGVTLGGQAVPEKCNQKQKGLLVYSDKDRGLYFCGNSEIPIKIHDNPDFITEQKLITIKNNLLSLKREQVEDRYKICRLSSMKGLRGKCSAHPSDPKDGKSTWELLVQYESGPEISCEFLCGN